MIGVALYAGARIPHANEGGDPFFSRVLVLLHGDGTNGSTTFTDDSSYARTMTIFAGSPVVSTAEKVFGTGSILGAGSLQIITPMAGAEWVSNNWTWEARYRRTSDGGYHAPAYFKSNLYIHFDDVVSGFGTWRLQLVVSGSPIGNSISTSALNTWDAWAVSVSELAGNFTWRIFCNGVLEASGTSSDINLAMTSEPTDFNIGRHDPASFAGLTGYLDETRVTTVCRYTASYTVAAEAFPDFGS